MSPEDTLAQMGARLEWLTLDNFVTIEELQRETKPARVKQIADEWDNRKVGVVLAAEYLDSEGIGRLHITDGNHRLHAHAAAAAINPKGVVEALPTVVFTDMSRQDIAIDFIAANNDGRKIPPYDNWRVAKIAKEPWALSMQRAFQGKAPFRLGQKPEEFVIAAINSVKLAMKRAQIHLDEGSKTINAEKAIRLVQEIILQAWPTGSGKRSNGDTIQALMGIIVINKDQLFGEGSEVAVRRLVETLGTKPAGVWINESKLMKENEAAASSGSRYRFLTMLWARAYNKAADEGSVDTLRESA